jgi:Family of unknown function (DUF6399)
VGQKGSVQTTFLEPRTVPIQPAQTSTGVQGPRAGRTRERDQIAGYVLDFEKTRLNSPSQRQFSRRQGLPRSTLSGWLKQKQSIPASPDEVAFFESPAGLRVVHRIQVAAHLVMSLMGACGIRLVCLFLDKAGLSPFVASSYGAQSQVAKQVEQETVRYGQQERARLEASMSPKPVTLVEDETFHQKPCLVAIEPVSNFILVEQYSEQRDSASWQRAVEQSLRGLPVHVLQVASDQGKAVVRHVETELGVHQSPDVFHVQYEVSRGTSASLAAQRREAQAQLDQASQALQEVLQQEQEHAARPAGPGRPPDFAARTEAAKQAVQQAQQQEGDTQANQDAMHEVIRGIGTCYHPYDLSTGGVRREAEVQTQLGALFDKARAVAHKASLPARCLERIEKAARVVPKMVATVAFFHALVGQWVATLDVPPPVIGLLLKVLIPMLYLKRAARRAKDATARATIEQVVSQLEAAFRAAPAAWQALPEATRSRAWALAQQCADLFQRSSSCVEGRNGQLSLRHHHLHQISTGRLQALTVIHNYVLQRADGTTAAERLFGVRPNDLFTTLCLRLPWPARPRKRRRSPAPPSAAQPPAT